jgi:putative tricarboxylic transport membrane protein
MIREHGSRIIERDTMRSWRRKAGPDFWSGLVLILLSGYVILEAFSLELGTPRNPGSGFMLFGVAAVLGLFALRQFIAALLAQPRPRTSGEEPIHHGRIVSAVMAVIAYILLLQPVGYLLCTFLLMAFLLQVLERGHWTARTLGAAVTSLASYLLFAKALQVSLPKGLLTFF